MERLMTETDRASPPGAGRSRRAALEEERDFCLRSLRDLEAEHAAGDLDDVDYRTLRESYVARAAAALRQVDLGISSDAAAAASGGKPGRIDGVEDVPRDLLGESPVALTDQDSGVGAGTTASPASGAARRSWRTRILVGAGVLAVAAGAAWGVVASSATRLPGQEITGQAVGSVAAAESLQAAQQASARGDALTAVKDYQKVLQSDPNQPEALTGEGWILAQTQQPSVLQQGLTMLAGAERADPTYAPAHLYRGIALLSEDDYTGAIPELQWYLSHDPDPQLVPRVRTALQQAQAKAGAGKGG
jgi:tetratricopeptide (TPR) repeat protein